MKLTLKIWRQPDRASDGAMHTYEVDDISEDMSFLEMLDVLNERLNSEGEEPIAFDSDCREGICGMCGLMINGEAHGPEVTTTCQLHMRSFTDGETITIEPWRADPFPVLKDLCVDRSAFDRMIQSGGYISVNTGAAPDAHAMPVPKDNADRAFDVATCIGCGACVAACPNGSASLFLGAKITHLGELPQGQAERDSRVVNMVAQHDHEGFGGCTNIGECTAACPKEIPLDVISQLNKDLRHAIRQGLLVRILGSFQNRDESDNYSICSGSMERTSPARALVVCGATLVALTGVGTGAPSGRPRAPPPPPVPITHRWRRVSVEARSASARAHSRSYDGPLVGLDPRRASRLRRQRLRPGLRLRPRGAAPAGPAARPAATPGPPRPAPAPPPCARSTSCAR